MHGSGLHRLWRLLHMLVNRRRKVFTSCPLEIEEESISGAKSTLRSKRSLLVSVKARLSCSGCAFH